MKQGVTIEDVFTVIRTAVMTLDAYWSTVHPEGAGAPLRGL
jgi:hypothetical protein